MDYPFPLFYLRPGFLRPEELRVFLSVDELNEMMLQAQERTLFLDSLKEIPSPLLGFPKLHF